MYDNVDIAVAKDIRKDRCMLETEAIVRTSNLEIRLAKIYIFLLPIRMISPLLGIAAIFHGAAIYFDFILNILGILLYLYHSSGKIYITNDDSSRLTKDFVVSVVILNAISILMAIETQIIQGNYAGESAFSGIIGMQIYYFQFALIILYNRRVFTILLEDEIWKILSWSSTFLLMLGYIQIAALLFGGFFRNIINSVDVFHILWPDNNMWKLSLTGKEGAEAGTILGVLVLPYLLSSIAIGESKFQSILQIILWIPVLVMMQSTSAYLMAVSAVVGYFFFMFSSDKRKQFIMLLLIIFCGSVIAFFGDSIMDRLPSDIRYLIFTKATDMNNGSTISRMVPLITNWKAFLEHPLFGVGNGLQGYYFTKNIPQWMLNVPGSDIGTFYQTAKSQIINGGVFFPSYLSGYGIIGIGILMYLIYKIKRIMNYMKMNSRKFYTLFSIAILPIVVCGFQGDFSGNYLIWFVISLPFISYCAGKHKHTEDEG